MRRTLFIFGFALVLMGGLIGRAVAQEKDSTEEELRKAIEALGSVKGIEGLKGLKALERLGYLNGYIRLNDLESLKSLEDLDLSSLDVADEYVDILEQCRGMIEDYEDYLDQVDKGERAEHEISVDRIRRRLDDNTYIDDPEKLIADLTETINAIKEIENAHKVEKNSNNPRCCRVIRNLRKEMVILVDLVEDYNDQHVETVLNRDEIKKYMEEAVKLYVEALKQNKESFRQQQQEERVPFVVIPPSAPEPPSMPSPPAFPEWREYGKGSSGEVGLVRRFEDSLRVTSSLPVKISNSAGGVQVMGWNEDFISAVLGVEVSSDSRIKEKRFADDTRLKMSSAGGSYQVEAKFPELSDPETKIIRCLLLVNVPDKLQIESDNSFGDVLISDMRNGAEVTSRHSSVTVDNVFGGRIVVKNTMGKISLSDIRGDVMASTSYAPISLVGCDGKMDIENAYARVTLSDTRGTLSIKNSGKIIVQDHTGQITIDNSYGTVQVQDVKGDVIASNAYESIDLNEVKGSVQLKNVYSQISVSDVRGRIEARNSHGLIQVEEPDGPVILDNKNGNITMILDSQFRGGSTVTTSHGTINLVVSDDPNLKILASVTDGKISSPLTYNVETRGNTTEAEWVLGSGGQVLKIVGNASNLVVSDH